MHYLAIFLPNSTATGMPYLPAKDELVSLDRLSFWGLWKWYNSKRLGPATIWRGAAFHFLAVFSKMKILWKLWLWFSKMVHQRVPSHWKWSISKFQFWQRIFDIYRQPPLRMDKRKTFYYPCFKPASRCLLFFQRWTRGKKIAQSFLLQPEL